MVQTTLNYFLDPSLGGITWYTPGAAGVLCRKLDTRSVQIHYMRDREADFNIHKQSFQLCKFTTAAKEFTGDEIKSVIYPEAEELLKKV